MTVRRVVTAMLAGVGMCFRGAAAGDQAAAPGMIVEVAPGGDIQAALDRVAAAGGGTVQLGAGTYVLRQTLMMRSRQVLAGRGPATMLVCDPEARFQGIGTELDAIAQVTLRDFALVGPGRPDAMGPVADTEAAKGPSGIFMNFATGKGRDLRLERLRVTRWETMGVHLKGVDGLVIDGCDFDCTSAFNPLYHNVYLRRTRDVQVRHCLFRNSPVGNGFQASFSERVRIIGNWSVDNAGHGIRVAASSDVDISGNTVLRNGGGAGIWLNCERQRNCTRIAVRDNVVRDNVNVGIAVRNTDDAVLEGNAATGNGTDLEFRNARDVTLRENVYGTRREVKENRLRWE